jgi:histone H1/5
MPLLKEQRAAAGKLAVELGAACEETGCRALGEASAALHNAIDERRGRVNVAELVADARSAVDAADAVPDALTAALEHAETELAKPASKRKPAPQAAPKRRGRPPKAQTTAPEPAPKRRGRPPKAKATTPKPAPPARPEGEVVVRVPLDAVADLAAAGWTVKLERG